MDLVFDGTMPPVILMWSNRYTPQALGSIGTGTVIRPSDATTCSETLWASTRMTYCWGDCAINRSLWSDGTLLAGNLYAQDVSNIAMTTGSETRTAMFLSLVCRINCTEGLTKNIHTGFEM